MRRAAGQLAPLIVAAVLVGAFAVYAAAVLNRAAEIPAPRAPAPRPQAIAPAPQPPPTQESSPVDFLLPPPSATQAETKPAEKPAAKPDPALTAKAVGEEGALIVDGDTPVPVAASQEDLTALFHCFSIKDKLGYLEMVKAGQVAIIPAKTKVLVIESGGFLRCNRKVRIQEGDYVGEAGWVPMEWVQ